MSEEQPIWELRQGETVIGRLTIYDEDMGWSSARFEAAPAYEPYRALFAEGAQVRVGEDAERWQDWRARPAVGAATGSAGRQYRHQRFSAVH